MNAPTTIQTRIDRVTAVCGASALVFGLAVATLSPHPGAPMIVSVMLLLGAGWVVIATLLTHAGSSALACELADPPGNFHALSAFGLCVRLANGNRRWPALFLMSELRIRGGDIDLESSLRATPQLNAREIVEFRWRIISRMRGEHEIIDLRVTSRFPGSLIRSEQTFAFGHRLLALPAVYRLVEKDALQLLIGRRYAAGRLHANSSAMEEFIGVRQYRPGDNPRHIHLVTSLRMPDFPMDLAVREFEDPTDDDVCIVLDTHIASGEADGELLLYRHEKSLSFAVALCRLLCARKHRVRFCCVEADGKVHELRIQHPVKDLARLETLLARLQPTTEREAVWQLLEKQTRSARGAVLYVSLREIAEEKRRPRLAVLSVTPDWHISLVKKVISA